MKPKHEEALNLIRLIRTEKSDQIVQAMKSGRCNEMAINQMRMRRDLLDELGSTFKQLAEGAQ
jgi:hypothetical protein